MFGLCVAYGVWGSLCYLAAGSDIAMMVFFTFLISLATMFLLPIVSDRYAIFLKLIGPVGAMFVNEWRDGAHPGSVYGFTAMLTYDIWFMCQGIIDMHHLKAQKATRDYIFNSLWAMPAVCGSVMTFSFTNPCVSIKQGFLFFYPLYETTWLQNNFTIGTYLWVYIICWVTNETFNKVYDPWWFDFITGASMWAYISHYLWMVIVCRLFVVPFWQSLGLWWCFAINWAGTMALVWFTYWLTMKKR